MIRVCTGDDRTEHDGFVRLVLEVPVPEFVKFRSHLLELFRCRPDLKAGVDKVRGQSGLLRASLPFCEKFLLNLLDTTKEVISGNGIVRYTID